MNRKQRKARLKYLNSLSKEYKKRKKFAKRVKLTALLLPAYDWFTSKTTAIYCKNCIFAYVWEDKVTWCAQNRIPSNKKLKYSCVGYLPLQKSTERSTA